MPKQKKPWITSKCVANAYADSRKETIAEFWDGKRGGLIALRVTEDNKLLVNLYRLDPDVVVTGGNSEVVGELIDAINKTIIHFDLVEGLAPETRADLREALMKLREARFKAERKMGWGV